MKILEKDFLNLTSKELAEKYKCSRGTIYNICKRNGWTQDYKWDKIYELKGNPLKEDSDSWYIIGYILGDGNLNNSSKHSYDVRISSYDYVNLMKIKEVIEASEGRDKQGWYIQTNNRMLYRYLESLGLCERKSFTGCEVKIDEQYEWDFLRGLLDSDGNVSFSRSTRAKGVVWYGHPSYMKQVALILNKHGLRDNYRINNGLAIVGVYSLNEIRAVYQRLYKTGSFFLERKKHRMEEILDECKYKISRTTRKDIERS